MNGKEKALWNIELFRDALKRQIVTTESKVQWLGMCELMHDTIHELGGNCGDSSCDGADIDILSRFVDRCT